MFSVPVPTPTDGSQESGVSWVFKVQVEDYQLEQFLDPEHFVGGRQFPLAAGGCGHLPSSEVVVVVVDVLVVLSMQWMGVECGCE